MSATTTCISYIFFRHPVTVQNSAFVEDKCEIKIEDKKIMIHDSHYFLSHAWRGQ